MIFFLDCGIYVHAGQTVRIDFFPGAAEEFDIFFKKGFESEGYTAFVNYFDRSRERPFDLLFQYEWTDGVLKGSLYNKAGKLIRQAEENIIYLDRIESITYQFLGELLDKIIKVKDRRGRIKHSFGVVGFEMVKLDSAIYAITVMGSENMSVNLVESEFFKAGIQLTGEFRTYYEGSYHQYEAGQNWLPSSQLIGWKVKGVIIGWNLQGKSYIILPEPPEVYSGYLARLTEGLAIPSWQTGDATGSKIYILRNSNKSADYGPNFVYLDGQPVCELYYKKYAVLPVSSGTHFISVKGYDAGSSRNNKVLQVKVPPSQNTFVSIIWSFHIGIMYQEIKEYEAKILIRDLAGMDCSLAE